MRYDMYVQNYFGELSNPAKFNELKELLSQLSARKKLVTPRGFADLFDALLAEEGKGAAAHYDRVHRDAFKSRGKSPEKTEKTLSKMTSIRELCKDSKLGPSARRHIEAIQKEWRDNTVALVEKYTEHRSTKRFDVFEKGCRADLGRTDNASSSTSSFD